MTSYINKLKDKTGNQQLPVTHERAVRDDNGTTLESKMQNLEGAMDKAYVAQSDNGMGRITLKKNMVSGVNTLTQSMMQASNTIYVIQYDFVLGENITMPADCVLEFEGGSISGAYTITGQNTGINAGLVKIFNTNITLAGTWNVAEAYPEWFGAKGDGTSDDTLSLQKAIDWLLPVSLSATATYIVSNSITIKNSIFANKATIKIKEAGVEYNVINISESSYTKPIVIRDLIVKGVGTYANNDFAATGILIDSPNVTLDNCFVSFFKVGILVKKWSITIINCTSVLNEKNLSMYGAGDTLVNDVNVIGGNYSSPYDKSVIVGDVDYPDHSTSELQGVRILLQGFCTDGGPIIINDVANITLDNIYSECRNGNNININAVYDNGVRNCSIKNCYLRFGEYGIFADKRVTNLIIENNTFYDIVYTPVYIHIPSRVITINNHEFNRSGYPFIHTGSVDGVIVNLNNIPKYYSGVEEYNDIKGDENGRLIEGSVIIDAINSKRITYTQYGFTPKTPATGITLTKMTGYNVFGVSSEDIKKLNGGELVSINGMTCYIRACDYINNKIYVDGNEPSGSTYTLSQISNSPIEEVLTNSN